jgi:hypothetical protein
VGREVVCKLAAAVVEPVAARVAVPSVVEPTENVTVPVGAEGFDVAVTIADNITELP